MAALAPLNMTPARQPFGLLDSTKLRNLQSIKNRQNAITPNSAPSLKRRYASPELSDSENVNPNLLDSVSKRKRSTFDDDVSVSKPSLYSLNTIQSSKPRLPSTQSATPRLDVLQRQSTTPASAPAAISLTAPAGRSPTRTKSGGLLNPISRKRFAPPTFHGPGTSLSIAAALSGTLAQKRKPRRVRTIAESKPKAWFFDIFEEPEEKQCDSMNEWSLSQGANILDISDDESKSVKANLHCNKENVDPNGMEMGTVTRSMAAAQEATKMLRKDIDDAMQHEAPRTPLAELDVKEYYAEGLDASSVVLVQEDDVEEQKKDASPSSIDAVVALSTNLQKEDLAFNATTTAAASHENKLSTAELGALLVKATPGWDEETLFDEDAAADDAAYDDYFSNNRLELTADKENSDGAIEIWESESAKDENED